MCYNLGNLELPALAKRDSSMKKMQGKVAVKAAIILFMVLTQFCFAQAANKTVTVIEKPQPLKAQADTGKKFIYDPGNLPANDSVPTVSLREVNIVSFKTIQEWNQYYTYRSRILKVMPYVKIAKELYVELQDKEENSKRRDYRHYRKDVEKEMRGKFEKELKDLTTSEGEMLFKLINRETGNNAFTIIKELKGSFIAWFYQQVGKHYGYNLKNNYDPGQEKMIELIIRQLGSNYKV